VVLDDPDVRVRQNSHDGPFDGLRVDAREVIGGKEDDPLCGVRPSRTKGRGDTEVRKYLPDVLAGELVVPEVGAGASSMLTPDEERVGVRDGAPARSASGPAGGS
jgi:hypothetical protein